MKFMLNAEGKNYWNNNLQNIKKNQKTKQGLMCYITLSYVSFM